MKIHTILAPLGLTLFAAASQCSPAPPPPAQTSSPQIVITDVWSRSSPMEAGNGAIYMTIANNGDAADRLLSAATDAAEITEIHETSMAGEVMKMSPIPNIEVPAGAVVALEPGGKHIMLMNLKQLLAPGQKISLTLNFEKSGPLTVEAEIRAVGAQPAR